MQETKAENARRVAIWVACLLFVGGIVAVLMLAEVGQYYQVTRYLIVEAITLFFTVALAWAWFHFATTANWILTQTFLASLLFILLSVVIAAVSYAVCPHVYTPDGRNSLQITAAFVFPLAFTALMYFRPPLEIAPNILPGGGIGQIVVRGFLSLVALGGIVWLFMYNF